jgi:hypothetical protein
MSQWVEIPLLGGSAYPFKQRSRALGSPEWMQAIPRKRYALFLQPQCGYACGDHETSAIGP